MKTTVNGPRQCPSCGTPMPAGALAGLCPACLLAQGADTDPGDGSSGARFEPPPIAEVAKLFPQLEILDLLGAGGMGAVYKARQPALDRIVALKILPSQNARGVNFTERFNREARALARLNHPNIVAVHEFGQAGALSYFIMEFVDGANLRLLEQGSRLSPREALQIIPQICDALQYAHDEGVVHRDIKPENVLVDRKGRVKIADFGLAKILGTDAETLRLTAEGQVMGTPHYMAPEQIEKPLSVDHRADIYALGVVLYEMLTGDLPLGKFAPPSRKVQVDVRLDDVVLRALENDPERRYQKASEVKTQVETIAGTPGAAAAAGAPKPRREFVRWAGFPLLARRGDGHATHWLGVTQACAVMFALLTVIFGLVSILTGKSVWGWLGIVGWPSLAARLVLSTAFAAWGLRSAWRNKDRLAPAVSPPKTPQGTVILPAQGVSRKAVLGACWTSVFFLAGLFYLMAWTVVTVPDDAVVPPEPSLAWWQILLMATVLPLGAMAPFGATVLGWLAVGDIRRSRGRISGLPLAVFDGLFFPLLAFAGLLAWLWTAGVRAVAEGSGESFGTAPWPAIARIGAVVICLVATFDISRRVWRAVRVEGETSAAAGVWWWSGRAAGVTLAALCIVLMGVVASRRSSTERSRPQPAQIAQRDAQTGRLVARLPGRGSVELLAVGERHGALNGWWAPDGTPLSNALYEVRGGMDNVMGGRVPKEILFRATDLPEGASFVGTEADPVSGSGSGGAVFLNGRRVQGGWQARFAWEPSVRSASVSVGHALQDWRTIATHDARYQSRQHRLVNDPNWTVNFHHRPTDTRDGSQIAVVFGPENRLWSHRMVAIDTNGLEHAYSNADGTPIEKLTLWTFTFRQLPLEAVKEFRLQVRPVHWVEFRDIALSPRSPVPPPIPARFGPVMERTFSELIDFDTGKTSGYPAAQPGANPLAGIGENILWMQENGFDAETGIGELHVVNMEFVALENSDWDTLTAPQAMDRLERGSRFAPRDLKPLKEGQLPATFVFRTREGGIGILQLVAFAGGKPQATVRFKLRESGAAQAAKPDTSDAARLVFGGVQERNVAEFIDLDTGKTAQLPEGDDANFNPFEVTPALLSWMQENGLDAHAGAGKIETLGVSIVDLAAGDWDLLQPDALVSRLRDSGRFQMQLEPGLEGLPATFGFRTREGGAGLLQIVSFEKRRPGATVRIKLLSKPQPR